jgi:predicted HAD superfamily Cof-like phosphohydrolase
MTKQQKQVLEFMRTFDQHLEVVPQCPPDREAQLRKLMIIEECSELISAIHDGNLEEVADACADIMYVVLGTANSYGFDLEPVFDEVHRSNMTKIGGRKNAEGKLIKPSTYSPANIKDALRPWG